MKCSHCNNEIKDEGKMILINCDGDFVCNEQCQEGYKKEMHHFLNHVVHSVARTTDWLMGGSGD